MPSSDSPQLHPPHQEILCAGQGRAAKCVADAAVTMDQVPIEPQCKVAATADRHGIRRSEHIKIVSGAGLPLPTPGDHMRLRTQCTELEVNSLHLVSRHDVGKKGQCRD